MILYYLYYEYINYYIDSILQSISLGNTSCLSISRLSPMVTAMDIDDTLDERPNR